MGNGRRYRKNDAPLGALARTGRVVKDAVSVVDAVRLQDLHRSSHVRPGQPKLARVRCGHEPATPSQRIARREPLRRMVLLSVIDTDAHHLIASVLQRPLDHFGGGCCRRFAIDGGHHAARDAEVGSGIQNCADDAAQSVGIYQPRLLRGAGGVPEERGIAHVMGRRVLQIFIRKLVKIPAVRVSSASSARSTRSTPTDFSSRV